MNNENKKFAAENDYNEPTSMRQNPDLEPGRESITNITIENKVTPQAIQVYKRYFGCKPRTYIEFVFGSLVRNGINGNLKSIELLYREFQNIYNKQDSNEEVATILKDSVDVEMIETKLYEENPSLTKDSSLENEGDSN